MPVKLLKPFFPQFSAFQVFGHGFLTKDGLKMGKSLGNVIEPTSLVKAYGPDAVSISYLHI